MKTFSEWLASSKDLRHYLTKGDRIDEKMYNYFLEVLPPISLKGGQGVHAGFQCSEPVTDGEDKDGYVKPLYHTFTNAGDFYRYEGLNFHDEVNSEYELHWSSLI